MYITLSSKNELSNSRFTNKFLDNLVIPPNSQIALVGATINQTSTDNLIFIPANTYIYLRTNDKNILRFQPNTTDTSYTKVQFCDRMNILVGLNKPYGINIEFRVSGEDININIFAEDDFDYNIDFMDYVWGGNIRPQVFNSAYQSTAGGTYPTFNNIMAATGTTSDQEPIQFNPSSSIGLPEQYSYHVIAPKQLTRDTTHASRSFDRARVFDYHDDLENHIYDSFGICWGPQNAVAPYESNQNNWSINWGNATFDRALNAYTKIPADVVPADASDYKEALLLKGDYTTELSIFNSETNAFDNFPSTYLPGDVIQHYLTNTSDAPPAPNTSALYNPIWRKLSYQGLHYWLPCCLNHKSDAANRQYNTLRLNHEEANNFLQNQADVPNLGPLLPTSMGFTNTNETSCNRAIGVASGFGQNNANTDLDTIIPSFISLKSAEIIRNTGEAADFFNNLPKLTRRDVADGLGAENNTQDRIKLTDYKLKSLESAAWQIFCIPDDDSGWNNGVFQQVVCLLGGIADDGTEKPILQLHMNQFDATDLLIAGKSGPDQRVNLTDAGGTRINPQWGNRYGVCVAYTKGDNKLKATVWEIAADYSTATPYTSETTPIYPGLPDVTCIGGMASGISGGSIDNSFKCMSGTIGHFRLYNFTAGITEATLPTSADSTAFFDSIGSQWTNNLYNSIVSCIPSQENLFASQDRKYAVTGSGGQPNNDNETERDNYCPVIYNQINASANRLVNDNYPDLVDVFFLPNVNIKYADNFEGVSNLDITAYTGIGSGIVLTNSYSTFLEFPDEDGQNERQIGPYTFYEPGDGSPYETITVDSVANIEEAQIMRININNLPIRTYNGTTGNISKCIYELQSDANNDVIPGLKTSTKTISPLIPIALNNAGDIVLNSLDVSIMDQNEQEITNIENHTSITVQIN